MAAPLDEAQRLYDAAMLLLSDFKRRRQEIERDLDRQEYDLRRSASYYETQLQRLQSRMHSTAQTVDSAVRAIGEREREARPSTPASAETEAVDSTENYGAVTATIEKYLQAVGRPVRVRELTEIIVARNIRSNDQAEQSVRSALKGLIKRKVVVGDGTGNYRLAKPNAQMSLA